MKKRLVNTEYFSYTKEGNEVGTDFASFVKDYVLSLTEDYDTIDLEHVLVSEIQLLLAEYRIEMASRKVKEKRKSG